MAWRAGWYSSALIEPPRLSLLFAFMASFLQSSARLGSPRVPPWLGWQRDLQQPQRETNLSSGQEEGGEVWGRPEECKTFKKLLPFWNS